MDCSESGDGMKKVSKLNEDLGESGVNKTHTKPKTKVKRVGTSADNNKTKNEEDEEEEAQEHTYICYCIKTESSSDLILSLAFSLMELVCATGGDSRLDLLFRAKPIAPSWPQRPREDPDPKFFELGFSSHLTM